VTQGLGRLERVSLREVWENEASHFTPWLAMEENLGLLGDTIGIELELEAQEKSVGPFSADILCKDTANDTWVLIENQLERTDHTHLGQLLTYAAGLEAVAIVWIAERFADEHRAAMDWLNEVTGDHIYFFGLETELWRIGESAIAPKFNIVSKPNNWSNTIKSSVERTELTETKKMQLKFWTQFREYMETAGSCVKATKALPQHWMNHAIGRSGFTLMSIASVYDSEANAYTGEIRVDLYIHDATRHYEALEAQREQIESQVGEPLVWLRPENKKGARIYVRKAIDITQEDLWPDCNDWLKEELEKFHKVFGPIVRELDANGSV